jgi:hypothetical protein
MEKEQAELTEEEIKPAIRTAIREPVQQGCKILEGIERMMLKLSDRTTAKESINRREKFFLALNARGFCLTLL